MGSSGGLRSHRSRRRGRPAGAAERARQRGRTLAGASPTGRIFHAVAIIADLIERNHPGDEKTGRQITVSADLIEDVLR